MGDQSVHARDVSQSVVVTGDGNQVRLAFGDTGVVLPLRRLWHRPAEQRRRQPAARGGEVLRELDILLPDAGKLPLVGREDLLGDLRAWLDDERDISVLALTGRAGTGKTRLALEFCRSVDSGRDAGEGAWTAGFISPADLTEVVRAYATRGFAWERRTLLVLDYAAQCHTVLARWLDCLANLDPLAAKLRLLLLEREAPESSGWWHELTAPAANGEQARLDLFQELRPRLLPDLATIEERRRVMIAAFQAARALRPETPRVEEVPASGEDPAFDRHLAQAQFGNPLSLVMAGMIAAERGPQAALALRRLDAARRLGRRELKRLTDLAASHGIEAGAMRHAVAFNGLAGGLPLADLRRTLADELAAAQRPNRLDALVPLLKQELPARDETGVTPQERNLTTIQPDLIGEAAIIEAFTEAPSPEEATAIVRRAYALGQDAAAQVLVRLVQDYGYALEDRSATEPERKTAGRVMGWLLTLAREITNPEQLIPLVSALPEHTTILHEPAAELTARLAASFRHKAEQGEDPVAFYNAFTWANNLANRLGNLGQHEPALAAAKEAIHLHRLLTEIRPDAFTSELAALFGSLANRFGNLGQHEPALAEAKKAVQLYRGLAKTQPDAFNPDLARSLSNLANRLSKLGQHEPALAAAKEAVRLYCGLAKTRPDAFNPDLAASLNNLANPLCGLGRREPALTATKEAVKLRRALAEARPDAFNPDLARSLSNLAIQLGDLGRDEAALEAAEEAARLRRALAKTRPAVFTPELVRSLWISSSLYTKARQPEAAHSALREGLERLRAFALPSAALESMTTGLVQSYVSNCKTLGHKPDMTLLAPVLEMFKRLQSKEKKK